MACTLKFMPSFTVLIAGYWLVEVPEDRRKETEKELQDKFLAEYLPKLSADQPAIKGKLDHTMCTSYKRRSEWADYSQAIKDKSYPRTDFAPSFARNFESTRMHIQQ